MSTSRLLLVRHGQIVANIDQRWHGSTDGHLTERGREEAELVAAHLARTRPEVAAVYSSPLTRARDTAAQIARALGLPVIVATGLAEYGIGILENETYADLAGAHRFFEQAEADLEWAPSGGESLNGVATRVLATWRQVAHEHRGREVALVSHGAAIAIGLATVLDGNPRLWPRYRLRNTSVTEIVLEPAPRLIAFDLVHHLEAVY